ncbi:hypothetical protein [Erwinia sp. HR93]|uniref:hypothetical protein n=1 Tax=Erwinia sp. HR93 TaxID=3094840 RepID=UPI002ADEB6B3|nr:hypothetical protein [Erwinia sp. HR93]MEA1063484.1 hypothetical protein [Erwinia sp. HR93]
MRVIKAIVPIVFSIAITILFISLYNKSQHQQFSCTASHVLHAKDASINMLINYTFDKKQGVVNITGNVNYINGEEKALNRKIIFNYHHEGNSYFLKSETNIVFPEDKIDDKELAQYLPAFLMNKNTSLYLKILRLGNGNYLFFYDPIPTYICKKSV